ncbi:MAG: S-methyl-5-thioribose-1-phosphate isomerase [Acidobacteriota bacterium]
MIDFGTSDAVDELSPICWGRAPDGVATAGETDGLWLLDQTRLPDVVVWLACPDVPTVAAAIRRLSVRGAPAIGVSAAYGLAVAARIGQRAGDDLDALAARVRAASDVLGATRPTAVNLRWALARGAARLDAALAASDPAASTEARVAAVVDDLIAWARRLHADDIAINRRMGAHGAALFAARDRVLTHCNAGALATAGVGTAVGVIAAAHRRLGLQRVWVDETRPLLQGARLTAWELDRLAIDHRLVTDSSVGALMARGLVDRVVVGADRVAANGDVANKIGTYVVAVLAARHGVPFYVAAPRSTLDAATSSGDAIPIEERDSDEVTAFGGRRMAPTATEAVNFAFDVTPADLVTAIITEVGVLEPPYDVAIREALALDPPVGASAP